MERAIVVDHSADGDVQIRIAIHGAVVDQRAAQVFKIKAANVHHTACFDNDRAADRSAYPLHLVGEGQDAGARCSIKVCVKHKCLDINIHVGVYCDRGR